MFHKSDSVPRYPASLGRVRVSRVPRRHQYYQGTKTSCAEFRVAYVFASPMQLPSPRSLPHGGDFRTGQVPLEPRHHRLSEVARTQDLPGSCRVHPLPLPRSRIPASSSGLALSAQPCSPRFNNSEDTSDEVISGLNHAASVSAAYASSRALPHAHARLASGGWLVFTGRESNPLDSTEKFPSSTSDFLLSQACPGAMLKNSKAWECQNFSEPQIARFDER